MATYKKPLKAFMATTLMGLSAQARDTADGKRIGSYAIDAFEAHKTITAEDVDKEILIPFHAVKTAVYGTQTADAEKADAYCGGGTEPINSLVFEMGDAGGGNRTLVNADCTTLQTLIEQTKNGQTTPKLSGTATAIYQEQTINLTFSEEALQYADYTGSLGAEAIETEDTQVVFLADANASPCVAMAMYGGMILFSSGRLEVTW